MSFPPGRVQETFRPDMLEASKNTEKAPSPDHFMVEQNTILSQILKQLKIGNPRQRAVIKLDHAIFTSDTDIIKIQFLNQGKFVKSLYTIIANNTTAVCNVGINEPVMNNGTLRSGISIPTLGSLILDNVEIENLYLNGKNGVGVSGPGMATVIQTTVGNIWVYPWSIPEFSWS